MELFTQMKTDYTIKMSKVIILNNVQLPLGFTVWDLFRRMLDTVVLKYILNVSLYEMLLIVSPVFQNWII